MNSIIIYSILSVLAVSLISFVGAIVLAFYSRFGKTGLNFMVSFAAGALLGDVFIHLLPELAEEGGFTFSFSVVILASILGFFILEKYIHLHHHHHESEEHEKQHHAVAWLNIIGDGLHNLIDGLIIGGAYLVDIQLGLATTVAVMLHEIPQEMGDFSILIYSGFSKSKALFYNFVSALTAVVGVVLALVISNLEGFAGVLVAIGTGSFIYIAVADLIPEIHKSKSSFYPQLFAMLLGIGIMFSLLLLE